MPLLRYILLLAFVFACCQVKAQQDMDLHLNRTFLAGKNILKIKRDFNDPYLWVLAQNNEVYRVNSLTNAVDNYTAQFGAYSNMQFIDIVGRSGDSVFVATNSANVLYYKKGTIKVFGQADGIAGVVNSIGIDNSAANSIYNLTSIIKSQHTVVIATANGVNMLDYQTEIIQPVPKAIPSRIFEMTYRNEMIHGFDFCRCYADTVEKYDVTELLNYTIYGGEIWLGGNSYGHNLKTAYYTRGSVRDDNYSNTNNLPLFSNQFWATEAGLFQNNWNYSYTSYRNDNKQRYFPGVNISKITSIYGLVSFDSAGIDSKAQENLLVGSTQGLYFSNSKYQYNSGGLTPLYTFFHADELGNKSVNDICVNANTYDVRPGTTGTQGLVCEDAIWVAATDGLYLLRPDYTGYVDATQKLQDIQFDGADFQKSEIQVCSNVAVKANVSNNLYHGNNIQWFKDGQALSGEVNGTLTITQPGDYNAVLYDACSSVHFETNHLKVTQIAAPVFTFNYPDQLNFCNGSNATFKTDDNPLYQYRWYKNGVLISGQTTAGFTTGNPGKYKVEVSACAGNWVASKEVQANFITLPSPVIKADKAAYCNGDEAVLTATVAVDGLNIINLPAFQYQWFRDGVLLPGETGATIKAKVGGKYRVAVTACSGGFALSEDDFQIKFTTLTPPAITADKPAYCIGDQAVLSVNYPVAGYTVTWFLNGNAMAANKNKASITATQPGIYTVNVSIDQSSCSQTSNPYPVSFENPPAISIERIVNTTLCDGQSVDLKATFTGSGVKWSTGQSGGIISVKQSGTYTATAMALGGCTTSSTISVQFLPNPTLNVPDATLCQFTNDQLTLTAPAGFTKYEWNGIAGTQNFTTGALGKVNLTVTDQNGCKASQTINITSKCKDIHVPNTFTPNGDGINDKWIIAGLENDLTVNVKVFNRLGALVFESQGYAKPWDATYRGKKLPAGVYFYIINAKGSNQVLSGSITVIY